MRIRRIRGEPAFRAPREYVCAAPDGNMGYTYTSDTAFAREQFLAMLPRARPAMTVRGASRAWREPGAADNGVGQVIRAMTALPAYGVELVGPDAADVIACHIQQGELPRVDVLHCHGLIIDIAHAPYQAWHHEGQSRDCGGGAPSARDHGPGATGWSRSGAICGPPKT